MPRGAGVESHTLQVHSHNLVKPRSPVELVLVSLLMLACPEDQPRQCVLDRDCAAGQYCDNATLPGNLCIEAMPGHCRELTQQMYQLPCLTSEDCKEDSLICLRTGTCDVFTCFGFEGTCPAGCVVGTSHGCGPCVCA